MLRDREIWLTALCYWIFAVFFVWGFLGRVVGFSWPVVAVLIVAAAPAGLLLAIYERRTESDRARNREALRSEGRFSEAAERASDSTFTWGKAWGTGYLVVGLLLLVVGIVVMSPAALLGALFLCGWSTWRVYDYSRWQKEEFEHRRTSAARLASATEGLARASWNDPQSVTAPDRPSSSDDSPAGPTS